MTDAHPLAWLHLGGLDPTPWARLITDRMPELRLDLAPLPADPTAVDIAIVWAPPMGAFDGMAALKAVLCLSAGVDAVLADTTLSPAVPVARLIHQATKGFIRDYVLHAVLHHHRGMEAFAALQRQRTWNPIPTPPYARSRIGILGLGELGGFTAAVLRDLGFPVSGWSRTPKNIPGIACHHGPEGLLAMAAASDILVSMLPNTPATVGVIDADLLAAMPRGAFVINAGRGNQLVEADLLAALASGHIVGATLDVMAVEPPAPDHPFWSHPAIRLTPHIAAIPPAEAGADAVVANVRRVLRGENPIPLADRGRGY